MMIHCCRVSLLLIYDDGNNETYLCLQPPMRSQRVMDYRRLAVAWTMFCWGGKEKKKREDCNRVGKNWQ